MRIDEICTGEVVFCAANTSVSDVARLMRAHHVGAVPVVEERNGKRIPIGLITDRDLVVEVLALDIASDAVTAGDVRSTELVTVRQSDDAFHALERMQQHGVRRAPVVDAEGALVGIVALDDLLACVAEELNLMAGLVSRERRHEQSARPVRATDQATTTPH